MVIAISWPAIPGGSRVRTGEVFSVSGFGMGKKGGGDRQRFVRGFQSFGFQVLGLGVKVSGTDRVDGDGDEFLLSRHHQKVFEDRAQLGHLVRKVCHFLPERRPQLLAPCRVCDDVSSDTKP